MISNVIIDTIDMPFLHVCRFCEALYNAQHIASFLIHFKQLSTSGNLYFNKSKQYLIMPVAVFHVRRGTMD